MSKSVIMTRRSAKYRGIIVSIAIFLVLILSILLLNLSSSYKIDKNYLLLNTLEKMRNSIQDVSSELFSIEHYSKSLGATDAAPKSMTEAVENIQKNREMFTQNLQALSKGGFTRSYTGEGIEIKALDQEDCQEKLSEVVRQWGLYDSVIAGFVFSPKSSGSDSQPLNTAIVGGKRYNPAIMALLDDMSVSISENMAAKAKALKIIQIFGIIAVVLYFSLFMFYFIREIKEAEALAVAARRETKEIMATVNEGLFLVDKNLEIGVQYSKRLETLIGKSNIAGYSFDDLIGSMISQRDLETSKSFIGQLFNEKVKEALVADLNPLDRVEIQLADDKGIVSTKYLSFNFKRVYQDSWIKRVLIAVSDITQEVTLENQLEREQKQNDQQMRMLTSILHADSKMLGGFLQNAKTGTKEINEILKRPTKTKIDLRTKANEIFREVHSLKGEASTLKLDAFIALISEFEDKLVILRNTADLTGNDFLPMTVVLDQLIEQTNRADNMMNRLGNMPLYNDDQSVSRSDNSNNKNSVVSNDLAGHFKGFVEQVAQRNDKEVILKTSGLEDLESNEVLAKNLKDIITQLLRNAVVHGIETPETRRAYGKKSTGVLKVDFDLSQETLQATLSVRDDGRGIAYEAIRQRMLADGLCTEDEAKALTKRQLLMQIFAAGFSTAENSTEDAGRGVGMDIIKTRVDQMKGKLQIQSKPNEQTVFVIRLPWR